MSLRIRRGTDAQRTGITFDLGEVVWTTDTQKLYVGDGLTAGGLNALAAMAGTGFTFNPTTQRIDFSLPNLNLNTSEVAEDSSRLYFTTTRAQASVAAALTAGNPYNSGISFAYDNINNRITAVATGNQIPSTTGQTGKYLTFDGANIVWHNPPIPGGLSIPSFTGNQGKYLTTDGTNLTWANVSINTLSYTTVGNVTYNANLTDTGFTVPVTIKLAPGVDITRDNGAGVFTTVLGGLSSVSADTSPTLGGNLSLGTHNITGTGNINTTGTITASSTITGGSFITSGTISTTQGLGADLNLNSHNITGTGNISTNGAIHALGGNVTADGILSGQTIVGTLGLGADLPLNSYAIKGTGSINITGSITSNQQIQGYTIVATGSISAPSLGADLDLSTYKLTGTNFSINGSTGAIVAASINATGLGGNLSLNNYGITGQGSINIVGTVASSGLTAGNISIDNNEIKVNTGGALYVLNSNQQMVQFKGVNSDGSGAHTPQFNLYSSRGSLASPVDNQAGDYTIAFNLGGYHSGNYQQMAGMIARYASTATMTDSNPGAQLALSVNNNNGDQAHYIFDGNGTFSSAGAIQTGSFSGSINYPYPASAGMIIFDPSVSHFYGYNGTTWKQLDN
jgi:hypothetical protein